MSLFKKLGKGIKRLARNVAPVIPGVGGVIAGAIGGSGGGRPQPTFTTASALPGLGSSVAMPMFPAAALPAIPAIGRAAGAIAGRVIPGVVRGGGGMVARTAGRVLRSPGVRKWSKRAAAAAGYFTVGSLIYDAAGNIVGQASRRRMNPLNHRALKRAVRRVKGASKIAKEVDKLTGANRRRRAPAAYCPPSRRRAACD